MSGIAGIVSFGGAPVAPELLDGMMQCLAHRGPDGITSWIGETAALGHCMLHTTAESLEEVQPAIDEARRKILVIDGRIDNWEELRTDLLARGARLRNRGDNELVLRAYELWGEACVEHLEGDFAFALLDLAKHELFCARDALGNKPFVYHWDGKMLSFASELSALLSLPWVPEIPNEGMVAEIAADELMSVDETLWSGVLRLPAAHIMQVSAGRLSRKIYWRPDLSDALGYHRDDEYIEQYRDLLTDQIRRLSRSHKPLAVEASGGLDSSAVLAIAHMLKRKGQLNAPSATSFTLAIEGYPGFNDLPYARSLAAYLGVPIEEVPPSLDFALWYKDVSKTTRDFPGHPNSSWSREIYRRARHSGARVLMTGLYADQFITGSNLHYVEDCKSFNLRHLIASLGHDLKDRGVLGTADLVLRHGVLPLLPDRIEQWLRRVNLKRNRAARTEPFWLTTELRSKLDDRRDRWQAQLCPDRGTAGQEALLANLYSPFDHYGREMMERIGAQSSLEHRHPYCTKQFIQFAFNTPERLRSRGRQGKYLHRTAMRELLPKDILERVNKANFTALAADQLRQEIGCLKPSPAGIRPDWFPERGVARLEAFWDENKGAGWPVWAFAGMLGCHGATTRE